MPALIHINYYNVDEILLRVGKALVQLFFGSESKLPLASGKMTDDGDQQLANCSKIRVQLFKFETVRRLLRIVELRILYLSRLCGWNFQNWTDSVEGLA